MSDTEIILEKINMLDRRLQDTTNHIKGRIEDTNKILEEVKVEVKKTNGRVYALEIDHMQHPITNLIADLNTYKEEMYPMHVIAKNWKMILGFTIALGIIFKIVDVTLEYLLNFS
jgi:hypothetical protein